jgi:tRNA G26 N,N-dimethylase Trm1
MTMLKANDAKEIAEKFFIEAEIKLKDWIETEISHILTTINDKAKLGHFSHEASLHLDNDNLRLPKEKIIIRELTNLGYNVAYSTRSSQSKEFSVFKILWR